MIPAEILFVRRACLVAVLVLILIGAISLKALGTICVAVVGCAIAIVLLATHDEIPHRPEDEP